MKNRQYNRNNWKSYEDHLLSAQIQENGLENWKGIARQIPGRTAKQCRERWNDSLNPLLKKGKFSTEENLVIYLMKKSNTKWSKLSKVLPGRTCVRIKNQWYSQIAPKKAELKILLQIFLYEQKNEENIHEASVEQKMVDNLLQHLKKKNRGIILSRSCLQRNQIKK